MFCKYPNVLWKEELFWVNMWNCKHSWVFLKPSFKETNERVTKFNILHCFCLCFEKALKKIQGQIFASRICTKTFSSWFRLMFWFYHSKIIFNMLHLLLLYYSKTIYPKIFFWRFCNVLWIFLIFKFNLGFEKEKK